jgi:hypothetical protein
MNRREVRRVLSGAAVVPLLAPFSAETRWRSRPGPVTTPFAR